jgi:hypothetical protein
MTVSQSAFRPDDVKRLTIMTGVNGMVSNVWKQ